MSEIAAGPFLQRAVLAVSAFVAFGAGLLAPSVPAKADDHGAPFFPAKMRPAMEWVDRQAHRDDPFLQLTFRTSAAPSTINQSTSLDWLTGYTPTDVRLYRFGHAAGGPADGAVYGFMVGKDTWRVAYDPVHHLAYYGEGCCAFVRDVVMTTTAAAPTEVPRRDLSRMHTVRGVRLGMRMAAVIAREGPAPRTLGPTVRGRGRDRVRDYSVREAADLRVGTNLRVRARRPRSDPHRPRLLTKTLPRRAAPSGVPEIGATRAGQC